MKNFDSKIENALFFNRNFVFPILIYNIESVVLFSILYRGDVHLTDSTIYSGTIQMFEFFCLFYLK